MANFTKGPWKAAVKVAYKLGGPVGPMFQVEAFPEPYWIAYVQDSPDGNGIANANLIAASPAMYEELKGLEWRSSGRCPRCFGMEADGHAPPCSLAAAIAAAEGARHA